VQLHQRLRRFHFQMGAFRTQPDLCGKLHLLLNHTNLVAHHAHLFQVASIALITIGSIILVNISSYDDFYEENAEISAIILISAGALTFLVAFLGCCGALKKSSCMMYSVSRQLRSFNERSKFKTLCFLQY
jgi:Tetraspanin family